MTILELIRTKAMKAQRLIGIGLGPKKAENRKIYTAAYNVLRVLESTDTQLCLVGTEAAISELQEWFPDPVPGIVLITEEDPSSYLIEHLFHSSPFPPRISTIFHRFDGIIRGGLKSAPFVKQLRTYYTNPRSSHDENGDDPSEKTTFRLALLETADLKQFFFGGVGIDEVNSYETKRIMIEETITFFQHVGIDPQISILSGGRLSDRGRDDRVDTSIDEATQLISYFSRTFPQISVTHHQILIEQAIADRANVIIAPEGIAGNLIYRTLIHLGAGRSYGAVYLSFYNNHDRKIIIDCSRVAPLFEIEGSFYLALGLPGRDVVE
jgi:predicted methyltransferase MtxX (methanogen marker protein 4)